MPTAALWSVAWRAFALVSGPINVLVVSVVLGPAAQGVYYAIAALVRWQDFLDLGFGAAYRQQISQALARRDDARVAGLLRLGFRWFGGAALVWLLVAPIAGGLWLAVTAAESGIPAWLALSVAAGLALPVLAAWHFVEAIGEVDRLYRFRVVQAVLARSAHWLTLGLTGSAHALAIERVLALAMGVAWLSGSVGAPLRNAWSTRARPVPHAEVWPLQWRIGLGTAGALVPVALLVPLALATNAVDAGRLGMVVSLFSALAAASASFVQVRQPHLTVLATNGDSARVRQDFVRAALLAAIAYAVGAGVGLGAIVLVQRADLWIEDRLLDLPGCALIAAAFALRLARDVLVVHPRAYLREVLWPVDVAEGAVAVLVFPVATFFGMESLAVAFAGTSLVSAVAAAAVYGRWARAG